MRRFIDVRFLRSLGVAALVGMLGPAAPADAIRSAPAPKAAPPPEVSETAPADVTASPSAFDPGPIRGHEPRSEAHPQAAPETDASGEEESVTADATRPTPATAAEPIHHNDPPPILAHDLAPGDPIGPDRASGVPAPIPAISSTPDPGRESPPPRPRPVAPIDPESLDLPTLSDDLPSGPAQRPADLSDSGIGPQPSGAGEAITPIELPLGDLTSPGGGDGLADLADLGVTARDLAGAGDPMTLSLDPSAGWDTRANLDRILDAAVGAEVRRRMFHDMTPDPAEVVAEARGIPFDSDDEGLLGTAAATRGGVTIATPEPSGLILIGLAALVARLGDPRLRRPAPGATPGAGR